MTRWRGVSDNRRNRDRREDAFARAVIARAEQLRREEEARAALPEPERCPMCNDLLSGNCEIRDDNYPYCSTRCSLEAELDSPEG